MRVPMGCDFFRPHPLPHCSLLHGCMRRSALCGAHGLQEHSLLLCGPLLGCRELLLCASSTSCLPWCLQGCFSQFLTPFSWLLLQLFPSLTLISQSIPSVAHGSAVAVPSLWSSSWNWLWSDMGQCWAKAATLAASCYQNLASGTLRNGRVVFKMNILEEIMILAVIQSEERDSHTIPVLLMRFWSLRTRPADD